jgi:hypothetical protein
LLTGDDAKKSGVMPLNLHAVKVPSKALAQMQRRLVVSVHLQFLRDRLKSSRGHVEQQFSQVRTTPNPTHILLNRLTPSSTHYAANHGLQCCLSGGALGVRRIIHSHRNVLHLKGIVDRHPDGHVMDWVAWQACSLARNFKDIALQVEQVGFDIPQSVFALVAPKNHLPGVQLVSGLG